MDSVPILVTYCPLSNSSVVYKPVLDGQIIEFGILGSLYKSNIILYDKSTKVGGSNLPVNQL